MNIFEHIRLRFSPPVINDPVLGRLVYMHRLNDPDNSFWECEWKFPGTGTNIFIGLPGDKNGPRPEVLEFFVSLPGRFDGIMTKVTPVLNDIFRKQFGRQIKGDVWSEVGLRGFGIRNSLKQPIIWEVSFVTTGDTWLGITIPFVGEEVMEPVVVGG